MRAPRLTFIWIASQGGFMDKLSDGMDGTATRLDVVQV